MFYSFDNASRSFFYRLLSLIGLWDLYDWISVDSMINYISFIYSSLETGRIAWNKTNHHCILWLFRHKAKSVVKTLCPTRPNMTNKDIRSELSIEIIYTQRWKMKWKNECENLKTKGQNPWKFGRKLISFRIQAFHSISWSYGYYSYRRRSLSTKAHDTIASIQWRTTQYSSYRYRTACEFNRKPSWPQNSFHKCPSINRRQNATFRSEHDFPMNVNNICLKWHYSHPKRNNPRDSRWSVHHKRDLR
jgi:hypothetical protein